MEVATVPETRPTEAEFRFVRFCQEVGDFLDTPFWMRNVAQFDKIFTKFRKHGKSHLPILAFISHHRSTLEQPVLLNSDPNDRWLLIPEGTPVPETTSWTPVRPRGVLLSIKEDEFVHSLPLSEVYEGCLQIASDPDLRSFSGVTVETVPAKFLLLLYQMLLEAEPDNLFFKENVETCDNMVAEAPEGPLRGLNPNDLFGSLFKSEGGQQISSMVAGMLGTVDPSASSAFTEFTRDGNFQHLLSAAGPLLQNLGSMFPPQHTTTTSTSARGVAGDSGEDADAEDQD